MDMITVLNTRPAQGPIVSLGILLALFCVLVLILFIWMVVDKDFKDVSGKWILAGTAFVLAFFSASFFTYYSPAQYKCTIKDNVDFKQFSNTFKVDQQRGDIYTVHLKADEK